MAKTTSLARRRYSAGPCRPALLCVALLACIAAVSGVLGPVQARESMSIAATKTAVLLWLADELGYLESLPFDVDLQEFSSGTNTAKAASAGEVDLATSSEFAFVSHQLLNPELRIVATLSSSQTTRLIGRAGSGIEDPRDLRGKRIGVTGNGIGQFFLARYLTINGVASDEVNLVDLKPAAIVSGMANGDLDAAMVWEPFVYQVRQSAEGPVVDLPDQDYQFFFFSLHGRAGWIEANRAKVAALLGALVRAEDFARASPAEAKAIFARRFAFDATYMDHLWPLHNLSVRLSQDLLFQMEEEAEWRLSQGLVTADRLPNYLTVVDAAPLKAARPSAVSIID